MAAIPIKLPTSIMSGSTVCVVPRSERTPSTVSRFDPTPEIFAPMRISMAESCWM